LPAAQPALDEFEISPKTASTPIIVVAPALTEEPSDDVEISPLPPRPERPEPEKDVPHASTIDDALSNFREVVPTPEPTSSTEELPTISNDAYVSNGVSSINGEESGDDGQQPGSGETSADNAEDTPSAYRTIKSPHSVSVPVNATEKEPNADAPAEEKGVTLDEIVFS
jgi:hypothetical protein